MKRKYFFMLLAIPMIICCSCSNSYKLGDLDKSLNYQCIFPDDTLFFKIEKQDKSYLSGIYYHIDTLESADPITFSAKLKKDIWYFNLTNFHKKGTLDLAQSDSSLSIIYFNKTKHKSHKQLPFFTLKTYIAPQLANYPKRYRETLFKVDVKRNIKYGEAVGYWNSFLFDDKSYVEIFTEGLSSSLSEKKLDLEMDIYQPEDKDITKRPLLMLIHGGAFYMGDKSNLAITSFCRHFAAMGYTTVSINYRLGFMPNQTSIERAGYVAIQDAHAAMRFLVAHAAEYEIDTSLIFIGGTSAGSITALNLAFMSNATRPSSSKKGFRRDDLGDIESSGNALHNSFKIKSVANMWGAVNDINIISGNDISLVSFHGNKDRIVPYDYSLPFSLLGKRLSKLFFDKMYGSQPIHQKMKKIKGREKLFTLEGKDHEPHVDQTDTGKVLNDTYYFIEKNMGNFFYEEIEPKNIKIIYDKSQKQNYYVNCTGLKSISWEVIGGFVIHQKDNYIQVIWRNDALKRTIYARGILENGATFFTTKSCSK